MFHGFCVLICMKRTIALVILLLTCVGLIAYVSYLRTNQQGYRQIARQQGVEARVWRNEAKQSRARIESLEITTQQLEEFYQDWVDSLSEDMEIKTKKWQNALSVGLQGSYNLEMPMPVVLVDSSSNADGRSGPPRGAAQRSAAQLQLSSGRQSAGSVGNAWIQARGTFIDGKLQLQVNTQDSLGFVSHLHRKGLFGPRILTADVISYNPYSTITGVRHFAKRIPPQKLGLGVFAGWDILNQRPAVGVAVQYQFVQF